MFFYSKLLTFVPGYFVIIGSGVVDAVATANEVQGIDTDTDNIDSTVHKTEANRGLRTVVMPPPSVRSLESNCSDTNWYWHPDEQKCARGLGALGISFSELPDCCKQAFGDNACDWHDECNHVPSSEQPVDVVEASDAPVEVEQTFFEAYHHGGNSNSVRVSTKAAKSSPSKSSKTGYITKMETAGIHVRMKGDGDSTGNRSALGEPNTVQVWQNGPFRIDAFCDKPKGVSQGPRGSYLGMELIVSAPANEDLYLIGQSMDIYHWTNNYDNGNSFDEDRCGNNDNCHKLLAGDSTIINMMDADHFFGGEYSDYRAIGSKARKRFKDGSAFYAMRPDGTYFYIGWNQNQFTGLHEDDFEISNFLGIDPDGADAVDCLMMGEINYYRS